MTSLWLITPISFLVGALSGGLLAYQWPRAQDRPSPRRPWALVATTVLATTLLLAAAGYGLVRHFFHKTPAAAASVGEAVADYRKAGGSPGQPGDGTTPAGGVYEYAAQGFYQVEAPIVGKERRVLPKTVPGILVAKGRCWELTLRYFKQHHRTERFCRDAKNGLRSVWVRSSNEIFSMKRRSDTSCTPDAVLLPGKNPGDRWTLTCKPKKPPPGHQQAQVKIDSVYVGDESLVIGGRAVATRHLRRTATMTGIQRGTFAADAWYAKDSGMLIQMVVKGKLTGMAKFDSDYRLTLERLVPKR